VRIADSLPLLHATIEIHPETHTSYYHTTKIIIQAFEHKTIAENN